MDPRLSLRFLGTFHVTLDDRPLTHFRSANVQGLLVYLALQASRPVPRDVLAALFWPDDRERAARTNLRQSLYQLRKVLQEGDRERPFLLASRETIQFDPHSRYALDVDQFEQAVEQGALDKAVNHYQGDLLPGFVTDSREFEDWLHRERERLHRLALNALHELTERQLARGREALQAAQDTARRQLALEPWREAAHRQLMRALVLAGERAAALAQYERCQEVLAEELGVPPAGETKALYEAIRDGVLAPQVPAEAAVDRRAVNHNLPPSRASFLGRRAEMASLEEALYDPEARLVTVAGPGGAGKTSLALAVARRLVQTADGQESPSFPDGIYFVELAPVTDAAHIPGALAEALGYRLPDDGSPATQLLRYLQEKQLLLILDNFEHLAPGAAFVDTLLSTAPGVTICATSRQPLAVQGEHILSIAGLALPQGEPTEPQSSAVRLFVQSARQAQIDYELAAADLPDVTQLCRIVGGLPLAIELAASWVDTLSPGQIVREIEQDLDFLAVERVGLPARQRSMRATFAYTWQHLQADERDLFARLSILQGTFTRDAARAVSQAPLRLLARLVTKALVQYEPTSDRYALHELLSQFGAEKLVESGAYEETGQRHSRYFLHFVAGLEQALKGRDQQEALAAIRSDFPNVRAAWRRAVEQDEVALLSASLQPLHLYADMAGRNRRRIEMYQYALRSLPDDATLSEDSAFLRDRILVRLYLAQMDHPDFDPAAAERLLARFQEAGDPLEVYLALWVLRTRSLRQGAYERALALAGRQTAMARRLGDGYELGAQLLREGFAQIRAGRFEKGAASVRSGYELSRTVGNRQGVAHACILLGGHATLIAGDYAAGEAYAREAVAISRDLGLTNLVAGLGQMAMHALLQGEFALCRERCRQLQEQAALASADPGRAQVYIGLLLAVQGQFEQARERLNETLRLTANSTMVTLSHFGLAVVAYGLDDSGRARYELLLAIDQTPPSPTHGITALLVWFVPVAVGILAAFGRPTKAAELLAAGRAAQACPHGWWNQWSLVAELEATLKDELGPAAYAAAEKRGRQMEGQLKAVELRETLTGLGPEA